MKPVGWMLCAALSFVVGDALAECDGYGVVTTVTMPASLTVQRDVAVGTVVYDSGWTGWASADVTCWGSDTNNYGYVSSMTSAGLAGVYRTGVPGIGIRVAWSNTLSFKPADITSAMIMQWPRQSSRLPSSTLAYFPAALYRAQLIVTGPVSSGTMALPNPTVSSVYGRIVTTSTSFTNTTIQVKQTGCTVLNGNIVVPLPPVNTREFGGVGATAGATAFRIQLNCDAGVKVAYQIDGTPAASGSGVLANAAGSAQAGGVGVQVLQGGAPIALNARSPTVATTTGAQQAVDIPFTARYYMTSSPMTPGAVSAVATFTMNYQ